MTAERAGTPRRRRRWAAALVVAAATTVVGAPAALAATTAADQTCTPDGSTSCIAVLVLDQDNAHVAGAEAVITGPEDFDETVTTTEDGLPAVATKTVGTYTIALDEGTLPADAHLAEGAASSIQVTAQLGSTSRAAFRVGDEAAPAPGASPGSGGSSGSQSEASSSGGIQAAQVWQQIGSGLRFGLLLALASIGLSLIYGTTKLSSFSHGEQVTLGAVLAYLTMNVMGLPIWLGAIITLAVCGATGWAQDAGIWRPLRRRGTPTVQLMIVTIGLSIALQFLIQLLIGAGTQRILTNNPSSWTVGPVTLTVVSWVSMIISVVVLAGVAWFLTRTRIGQATRAVSDNSALAAATGIDPDKIIRIVWVLATTLAGLGGMMLGMVFGSFNWQMGLQLLLLMFAAVTLGGLGTAFGALIGSLVIGMVVELSNLVLPSDLRYATALLILILVLLVRPQGILGRRERIG